MAEMAQTPVGAAVAAEHGEQAHPAHTIGHHHAPHVHHQFEDMDQQRESEALGMWTFLATEVMFFGGVFAAFIIYRYNYLEGFAEASHRLYWKLGTLNTFILLGSSLTVALSVRAAQLRNKKHLLAFLSATMVLGSAFLVVKACEYYIDYREHLIPTVAQFHPDEWPADRINPRQGQVFFSFYFVMTGIHATHMVIGLVLFAIWTRRAAKGRYTEGNPTGVEMLGLYWHFVDIVWIFLFPLLYLVG